MQKTYPKEVFSSIRRYKNGETKTFSIEALFSRGNENAPLVPPNYSRLKVSIFGGDGGVNGNIRETEIDAIYHASKACLAKVFEDNSGSNDIPQVPIMGGMYAGKTPAQVLEEYGDQGLEGLRTQRDFLKANLHKYPKNQAAIDSINKTAKAYKNGESITGNSPCLIYHSDSRSVGNEDSNGMKKVYGIDITYFDKKFTVQITNFKAPVTRTPNGSLRVQASEGVDKKVFAFDMNWDEWINAISKCKKTADSFDRYMFNPVWQQAEKLEKDAYEAYRN